MKTRATDTTNGVSLRAKIGPDRQFRLPLSLSLSLSLSLVLASRRRKASRSLSTIFHHLAIYTASISARNDRSIGVRFWYRVVRVPVGR